MPHREHQYELLSAYLDGELTPPQARNLEEALADEPTLRAELERLKQARDAVRTLPCQPAPAALAERVLGQIERGSVLEDATAPAGRKSPWTYYISAAAAAVVLLGLGLGAYLLLGQPSYLERQTYGVKYGPAEGARKSAGVPSSGISPELAMRPQGDQRLGAVDKREEPGASPSPAGPAMAAKDRPEAASFADSRPTELARAERPADGESTIRPEEMRRAEDQLSPRPQAGESPGKLTAQGPPLYEPDQAAPSPRTAPTALAAAPPAAAARYAGVSRGAPIAPSVQTARPALSLADAKPAVYFDLAEPDLRLVIRVKDLAAAQEHMRQVLQVAEQAHVAAEAADLGGAMCVSFNGRIVRQEGAIQYEFRIHPRAMPLLVRALTEMASLEQSWQVLQSPRPLESKWQVLRECLGEALAASQPVRDRVVISRQELPTTRGSADSIEMFNSFSLVASAAATAPAPAGPSGPPPAAAPAASTRPGQQWVEPYNLIVRIEAAPGDAATTTAAPAASATAAATRPAQ